MKVFISIDLEGISGVFSEAQTEPGESAYERDRELMRADLDAALEGCFAAGASEVVVRDGHYHADNLTFRDLPAGVSLVSGSGSPWSMMDGVDESCDAALFVGYHAMAGTRAAILDHTFTYKVFKVRVDDALEVGEFGLNAAFAGTYGVRAVFVCGDDKATAEAAELVPGVRTAVVKEAHSRTCARLLDPGTVRERIRDGVRGALSAGERPEPLNWNDRSLLVTFTRCNFADMAAACPGVERLDGRAIRIPAGDYRRVYRTFVACLNLAAQGALPGE